MQSILTPALHLLEILTAGIHVRTMFRRAGY